MVLAAPRAVEGGSLSFEGALASHHLRPLARGTPTTLQLNVGRRCNQACHHCHVEAGPLRTEIMSEAVVEQILAVVAENPLIQTVDITGGAPELHPDFRLMVVALRAMGRTVIDRCNLTVLFEPGMETLAEFLAAERVEIVASLPCYGPDNVDQQRGRGVFDRSIAALQRLNALGYAMPGTGLRLHLVYNPLGVTLPPPQAPLEEAYRTALARDFGVAFDRLFALTNMPIKRFAEMLERTGARAAYMSLLANHFNPATVPGLMCRTLLSVAYDGRLYDCDFNQMLDLPPGAGEAGAPRTIWDLDRVERLGGQRITTAAHCFGCTAGAGSSCTGALE